MRTMVEGWRGSSGSAAQRRRQGGYGSAGAGRVPWCRLDVDSDDPLRTRGVEHLRHDGSAMVARLAQLGTICVEQVTQFQLPTTPFVVRVTPGASSAPKPHAGALRDETWSIVGKGGCVG